MPESSTPTLTPERIAEKRRIAEAATKGPWSYKKHGARYRVVDEQGLTFAHVPVGYMTNDKADAAHIADNDPPSVLAMLDVIERLTAERDEARAELKGAEEEIECHATEEDGWEHDLLQVSAERNAALSGAKALREALQAARGTMRNAWGAVGSGQVTDKDVLGQLEQGFRAADAALSSAADKGGEG